MHRLSWIDAQIRQKTYPKCVQITKQFSLSQRQAAKRFAQLAIYIKQAKRAEQSALSQLRKIVAVL